MDWNVFCGNDFEIENFDQKQSVHVFHHFSERNGIASWLKRYLPANPQAAILSQCLSWRPWVLEHQSHLNWSRWVWCLILPSSRWQDKCPQKPYKFSRSWFLQWSSRLTSPPPTPPARPVAVAKRASKGSIGLATQMKLLWWHVPSLCGTKRWPKKHWGNFFWGSKIKKVPEKANGAMLVMEQVEWADNEEAKKRPEAMKDCAWSWFQDQVRYLPAFFLQSGKSQKALFASSFQRYLFRPPKSPERGVPFLSNLFGSVDLEGLILNWVKIFLTTMANICKYANQKRVVCSISSFFRRIHPPRCTKNRCVMTHPLYRPRRSRIIASTRGMKRRQMLGLMGDSEPQEPADDGNGCHGQGRHANANNGTHHLHWPILAPLLASSTNYRDRHLCNCWPQPVFFQFRWEWQGFREVERGSDAFHEGLGEGSWMFFFGSVSSWLKHIAQCF